MQRNSSRGREEELTVQDLPLALRLPGVWFNIGFSKKVGGSVSHSRSAVGARSGGCYVLGLRNRTNAAVHGSMGPCHRTRSSDCEAPSRRLQAEHTRTRKDSRHLYSKDFGQDVFLLRQTPQ